MCLSQTHAFTNSGHSLAFASLSCPVLYTQIKRRGAIIGPALILQGLEAPFWSCLKFNSVLRFVLLLSKHPLLLPCKCTCLDLCELCVHFKRESFVSIPMPLLRILSGPPLPLALFSCSPIGIRAKMHLPTLSQPFVHISHVTEHTAFLLPPSQMPFLFPTD